MPKLRNASTDIGAMTQYLARKCVIHSPQAELDKDAKARQKMPRFGTNKEHKGSKVYLLAERGSKAEPHQFVALSPLGRAIKVTVEEINPEELHEDLLKAVGT
jgi:hypothetical protein